MPCVVQSGVQYSSSLKCRVGAFGCTVFWLYILFILPHLKKICLRLQLTPNAPGEATRSERHGARKHLGHAVNLSVGGRG